jgi:Mg2+ and Co2+ transporter CorA
MQESDDEQEEEKKVVEKPKEKDEEEDEYSIAMKVMAQEERAKPSFQPTKTKEASDSRSHIDLQLEQARKARMAPKAARDNHMSADALDDNDLQYLSGQEDDDLPPPQPKATTTDRTVPCPSRYEDFLEHVGTSTNDLHSKLEILQPSKKTIKYLIRLFYERESMEDLDIIQSHLFDLAESIPKDTCEEFLTTINNLDFDNKGVLFLKCCGNVFPSSDFKHAVMSAVNLLIGKWIEEVDTKTAKNIIDGLFLSAMAHQYNLESKRIVPEVVSYLNKLLELLQPSNLLYAKINTKRICESLPFGTNELELTTNLKLDIRNATLVLLKKFVKLYADTVASEALFELTKSALQKLNGEDVAEIIQLIAQNQAKCEKSRVRLSWLDVKPVAIQSFTPLIYSDKFQGNMVDQDAVRLQTRILQRQHKRDNRGAVRELRKDNMFLRKAYADKATLEARERQQKYKEIIGDLHKQNHEHHQMDYSNRQKEREAKMNRKGRKEGMGKVHK